MQKSNRDISEAAALMEAAGFQRQAAIAIISQDVWFEAAKECGQKFPEFIKDQIEAGAFDAHPHEVGRGVIENPDNAQPLPDDSSQPQGDDRASAPEATDEGAKFKVLGYNGDKYYYFPYSKKQIVCLTPAAHNIQNLLQLAPLDFWEKHYGGTDRGVSKIALFASNALMALAVKRGIFDEADKVRGSGAWMDTGRAILHCGDMLYVDGLPGKIGEISSKYTYVAAAKLLSPSSEILSNAEAFKLRQLCEMPSWENKLSGSLLAGWLVIAPICAVLDWRPHIWVVGQAETGKSTIMDKIVKRALGDVALRVDGGTTEPAIRSLMRYDARPLIYDEAEAGNMKSKAVMAGVMSLVRAASSGATVVKFGQNPFTARFAICFSAIRPPIGEFADESRISLLKLRQNRSMTAVQDYAALLAAIEDTLTGGFSSRMLARIMAHLPVLLKNIKTFKKAAQAVIKGARASDQIAPMLAGLFFLHGTTEVTLERAEAWIREQDWTFHTTIAEDSDSTRALQHLCGHLIRYNPSNGTPIDVTVGDLIESCVGKNQDIRKDWAEKTLRNLHIVVKPDGVSIANRSATLEKAFRDTPWSVGWNGAFEAIVGANKISSEYFCSGIKLRATRIPFSAFFEETELPLAQMGDITL